MGPPVNFKPLDIPSSNFDFANAFDGTAIPPPPPSPPAQTSLGAKLKLNGGLSSHPTTPTDAEMKDATDAATMLPPAKKQQLSPASPDSHSQRPSSVRKLLSLRSLREKNHNHQNGGLASPGAQSEFDSRPGSPYGAPPSVMSDGSTRPSLMKKRSSGWFGSRRKSGFFGSSGVDENSVPMGGAVKPVPSKPRGPPPPTIPESVFKEFGSINGALSDKMSAEDLFKNIK